MRRKKKDQPEFALRLTPDEELHMTADDGYFAFVCGMWEVNKPMLPEETAAHVRKDTADYGKIQLTCRCGFGFLSLRQRYHECPKCGELYDLKPDEPGMSQFCRSG